MQIKKRKNEKRNGAMEILVNKYQVRKFYKSNCMTNATSTSAKSFLDMFVEIFR